MPFEPTDRLVAMIMDARIPLLAIARKHDLSLLQLARIVDSPEFAECAAALQRLCDVRESLIIAEARPAALLALACAARATASPIESRRAATTLLRWCSRPDPRRRSVQSASVSPIAHSAEAFDPAPEAPIAAQTPAPVPQPDHAGAPPRTIYSRRPPRDRSRASRDERRPIAPGPRSTHSRRQDRSAARAAHEVLSSSAAADAPERAPPPCRDVAM